MEACVAGQPSRSVTEAYVMKDKTKEIWQQFCEQAAVEQAPTSFWIW